MTRYPLLSSLQLDVGLGLDGGRSRVHLRRLVGELGFVQELTCADPALPSGLVVYLPTDEGIRALAEAQGLTPREVLGTYGLRPSQIYRMLNSLPAYYGLRTFMMRLRQTARDCGHALARFEIEPLFRFTRQARDCRARPNAFVVYEAAPVCYPFLLLWDPGYGSVDHFRGPLEALYDLREADSYPFPAERQRFPPLVVVTTDMWRLLEWQRLVRLSAISRRAGEFQSFVGLRRELRSQDGVENWRFFNPIWYDGQGRRVPLLEGAATFPLGPYRQSGNLSRQASVDAPPRAGSRRLLGDSLSDRARSLVSLAGKPQSDSIALLNLALKRREKEVLLWIGDHPLLWPSLLALLMHVRLSTLRRDLDRLTRLGLIRSVAAHTEEVGEPLYLLTEWGLAWLLRRRRERRQMSILRHWHRTGASLLKTLDHTRSLYRCMGALARWPQGVSAGLHVWESEFRKTRRYEYGGYWRTFSPDAIGIYRVGNRGYSFILETDLGTVSGRQLERKAQSFYMYRHSREFRDYGMSFPSILLVTTSMRRGRNLLQAFSRVGRWLGAPSLPIFLTTLEDLLSEGPLAPIWIRSSGAALCVWPHGDTEPAHPQTDRRHAENTSLEAKTSTEEPVSTQEQAELAAVAATGI